jgi:predicted DNA-binding protein with PD1-like motif
MVWTKDDSRYIVRLKKGEHLAENLQTFLREHTITSAWLSMIGAALEVELGFYNLETKSYQWRTFTGALEITGVHGNAAQDAAGETVLHLHGTLADEKYQVIGGHVKDLVVGGTCEIIIQPLDAQLRRGDDPSTGLSLLDL